MTRNKRISQGLMALFSLVFGASGLANLAGVEAMRASMNSLNMPLYMTTILGAAYVIGVVSLWQPVSARLKEWAFAGFTITAFGGAAAHILNGDGVVAAIPILVLWGILMGAYFLGQRSESL